MSKCKSQALVFSILAGGLLDLAIAAPLLAGEPGWILTQDSDYYGTCRAEVSAKGFKLESRKLGMVMYTLPPKWDVVSINDKSKIYCAGPLSEWKRTFTFRTRELKSKHQRQVKKGKTGTIAGLNAVQYLLVRNERRESTKTVDFWVARDIKVPQEASELIAIASGLPSNLGVPLRMTTDKLGHKVVMLDTLKSQRAPVSPASYQIPKGYKKVTSFMAMLLEEGSEDLLDGMLTQVGSKRR